MKQTAVKSMATVRNQANVDAKLDIMEKSAKNVTHIQVRISVYLKNTYEQVLSY